MKNLVATLAFAVLALVPGGCDKGRDLHDSQIRQQLTAMLGDLYTDRAIPKAVSELDAILTINSQRMSLQQAEKLRQARSKM